MSTDDIYRLARCLLIEGKTIHDYVMKLQTEYLNRENHYTPHTDLSLSQYHAVSIVHDHVQVTISELAELLGVSAPSASAMVDRLVEKGVFLRRQSTEDRRKVIVCIAEDAVEAVESVYASITHAFMDVVARIGLDQAQEWCDTLHGVRETLIASTKN